MSIITLNTEQLPTLVLLSNNFFQEEGVLSPSSAELKLELKQQLTGDFQCIGIQDDDQIVAMCLFRLEPNRTFIKRLYTLPEYRKKGYARQLLDSLQTYGESVYLHVAPQNIAAMNFYERLGGTEIFRTYEFKVR